MVTAVGVGIKSEFAVVTQDLLSLEYDALEAYKAAIGRLDNEEYRQKMIEFSEAHKRHINELSKSLSEHDVDVPSGPDMKKWLTQGKVVLANLIGDKTILAAMRSNEADVNTAYERINARNDIWDDARDIIRRGLEDERKHTEWLDKV